MGTPDTDTSAPSAALEAPGGEHRNQPPWELPGEGQFELSPEDLGSRGG